LPDHLIGHAVERDAAGKAQMVERHLALEAAYERQDRGIRRLLQHCGDIGMPRQDLGIHISARAEQRVQPIELVRLKADEFRRYCIVLLADAQDRLELTAEDLGIAIGCQAHDLRGVVVREAEITAEHLPQESERIGIVERIDGPDMLTLGLQQRRARHLADPVDAENGRAIEA
jgi:hypothetical protein